MKRIYCLLLILFGGLSFTYSQTVNSDQTGSSTGSNAEETTLTSSPEWDALCFVLGTLSDYMGRFQYVERQNQVDRYYDHEKPMVEYLAGYLTKELGVTADSVTEDRGRFSIYSAEIAKSLNRFYGSQDELMDSLLKTEQQAYSFLAGVYYRYGEKLDTGIYKFQMANSPKHHSCYELLKSVGCPKIFFKYLRHIPAQFILYFEPTPELEAYITAIEPQRRIILESRINHIKEHLKAAMSGEELDQGLAKEKEKERAGIKSAFQVP